MKDSLLLLFTSLVPLQAGSSGSKAVEAIPDKSAFSLFNPTPDSLMREFSSDRPDKTNSPQTLNAGHFQFETDLVSYTRNHDAGIRSEDWLVGNANLRIGLTNWADLQLLIPFYEISHESGSSRKEGLGDLTIGLKSNFWGNDDGPTSGGISLFLKTPTASHDLGNGKVEGAALINLGASLPADFDVGINSGVGITADDGGGYGAEFINSVSFSRSLFGPVSAYLEFYSDVPTKYSRDWVGTVDVGITVMVGKNFQLDTGVNFGVTGAADDAQTFLGLAVRF